MSDQPGGPEGAAEARRLCEEIMGVPAGGHVPFGYSHPACRCPTLSAALTRVQQEARAEAFEEAARTMCSECRRGNLPKRGPGATEYGHFLQYGPDGDDSRWFDCVSAKLWRLARARSSAAAPPSEKA
jgi:hypothetical protein